MRLAVILLFASLIASCGGGHDDTTSTAVYSFEQPVRVYTARKVYTGNPEEPLASGIVVGEDGRILAILPVDFSGEIFSASATPEVISRPDSYMYPGFVDGHIHFLGIGARALQLDFTGTSSIEELQRRLAAEIANTPPGAVIYGGGWIETGWPEGRMPMASDLDLVAPNNPVILERTAGHSVVVNSMALELAGIDADTVAPSGGAIERTASGTPNGLLVDNAMRLVAELVTKPSEQTLIANYTAAADLYVSRGWTGAHSM
ncbi:MAG: amidohydrolase family protein, partial [Henriciella sp.]